VGAESNRGDKVMVSAHSLWTRISASSSCLAILLLTVQLLPSLLLYIGADSSMALGATGAAVGLIAVFFARRIIAVKYGVRQESDLDVLGSSASVIVLLLIIPHAAIANVFQPVLLGRLLKSLVPLSMLLAGSLAFAAILRSASDDNVHRAAGMCLLALSVIAILKVAGIEPRADVLEKPMFPFTEPSHYALAFTPLLLYRCRTSTGLKQLAWLLGGAVLALVVQSLTLLAGCLLAAIICRRVVVLTLTSMVVALSTAPFDFKYFSERLDLSSGTQNLSSLVYLQGWQIMFESWARTAGWGVGFQQLGVHGTGVMAADAIGSTVGVQDLNVLDGSFVFAKLVGEFGVLGLLIGIACTVLSVRSAWTLTQTNGRPVITLARCVAVGYLVDLFVRGTGYFTGSTLLALTSLAVLFGEKQVSRRSGFGRHWRYLQET
jgi:hypothetical protein